jgi:ParB-like chromosome segregation protein Spo0J
VNTKKPAPLPWEPKAPVRRADIKYPSDSGRTPEQLQAEIDQAGPVSLEPKRRNVLRSALHLAEDVFQWRGNYQRDQWTRADHIYTLAKAIHEGDPLDPLLVMPVGKDFYVIDGHHRLAAYDTAGWTKEIPVVVFEGNLTEARVRALSSNVKDKLPMTAQAKSAAAWTITKEDLGALTAEEVRRLTGVSVRQVRFMRKVWRELNAKEGVEPANLKRLTWKSARDLWEGNEPDTDFDQDGWKARKAQEVVDLITRHNLTTGLLQDVEVTALALQMLSERLPAALIEQWATDHQELISDLAARIANPEDDIAF